MCILSNCKEDSRKTKNLPIEISKNLESAIKAFDKNKSDDNFSAIAKAYGAAILAAKDPKQKEELLIDAIRTCEAKPQHNMALAFATELVKLNPKHELSKVYFLHLADALKMRSKNDAATILQAGYLKFFGTSGVENQRMLASMPGWSRNIPQFMKEADAKTTENPDAGSFNIESTRNYIDYCESYAMSFPKNPESPEYLFKAAEMARAINDFGKTLGFYDWIHNYYPTHKHAKMALFLKGFMLENEFKKLDLAKESYDEFLRLYPKDDLTDDVKMLLANLGKSETDIIKQFDAKDSTAIQ